MKAFRAQDGGVATRKRKTKPRMKTYKCRAECVGDIASVKRAFKRHKISYKTLAVNGWIHEGLRMPDTDWVFSSAVDICTILKTIDAVPDTHTMIQTLQILINYTGERSYNTVEETIELLTK